MKKYHIDRDNKLILSGPYGSNSTELKKLYLTLSDEHCGNIENLPKEKLLSLGIVDSFVEDTNEVTKYGPPYVNDDATLVIVPAISKSQEELDKLKVQRVLLMEDAVRNYVECKGDLTKAKGRIHFTASPLVFAKGSANKPKSKAIMDWVYLVWGLYYQRLATLEATGIWDETYLDFSSCGEMPYTIQEAMLE